MRVGGQGVDQVGEAISKLPWLLGRQRAFQSLWTHTTSRCSLTAFGSSKRLRTTGRSGLLRCFHTGLQKEVMLAMTGGSLAAIPTTDGMARALREARLLATLAHPSLPAIPDVLEGEHGPVLVLEAFTGETLAARVARDGALSPAELRRLAQDVGGALGAIHRAEAVHRNVSCRDHLGPP